MRRLFLALAVLLAVVAGAGLAIWRWAPGFLVPRLEAALTRATGHPATIRGGIGLAWGLHPQVELRDLVVANAAWGSRPDMLVVPRLAVDLGLAALWRGTVRIETIRLMAPDLLLERNVAGHGNWERADPAPDAPARPDANETAGASPSSNAAAQIGRIVIAEGRLAVRDAISGRAYAGRIDGTAQADAAPVPLDITLRAAEGDLRIQAAVDRDAPLQRSSLTLTGQVAIPEPVDIEAKLTPGQAGQSFTIHAQGAGVVANLTGVLDPVAMRPVGPVALDATVAQGASMVARFGIAGLAGPASLHALVRQQGEAVTLREMRLALPAGEVRGDLDVTPATPPSVRGSLSSPGLDLVKALAPPVTQAPPAPAPAPAAAPATAPATAVPTPARLPLQVLNLANVDLRLAVVELLDGAVTLRDLSGHLIVQDGRLTLDPFAGTGPGGKVQLTLHADARATPPSLSATLHAPALTLQPLVAPAGLQGDIVGGAAIEADLKAAGTTQPELLQSLDGHASVTMADGDIDLHLLSGLVAAAKLPIDLRGRAHLRCLVVRADLAHGVARLQPLVIDATTLVVQGTGNVDLVQRTLALRLRPLLRTGPGLTIPLTLSGPWAKPRVDVDRGDVAGALAGLVAPTADACRAAGVTSTVAPPAAKPLKPADLLRSLLR